MTVTILDSRFPVIEISMPIVINKRIVLPAVKPIENIHSLFENSLYGAGFWGLYLSWIIGSGSVEKSFG